MVTQWSPYEADLWSFPPKDYGKWGERFFEGTRRLFTASGVEKPVLNAYRMLARLGDTRLAAQNPSEAQRQAIKARQGLELFEPDRTEAVRDGQLVINIQMPLPSVSLVELAAQ